ncbi:MAG: glycosyltransferase family 4 protein [Candidatus Edwardsbacteria bacterium]|jgi:glycosyltransferase involved in cell wall biosynthesis|nr:glycosyltransferase family 4 protein [Candidatus Edwardsbacteria bacterium]
MNILFVTPSDKVGGGNRAMFSLAAEIARWHCVELAFPANRAYPKIRPATNVRTTAVGYDYGSRYGFLLNHLHLLAWIRRHRPRFDAVVATGQTTGIMLPLIVHPALYNYIQTDEFAISQEGHLAGHPLLYRLYQWLIHRSLRDPDIGCLFNSQYTYRSFSSRDGLSGRQSRIIRCGVETAVFRPGTRSPGRRPVRIISIVRGQRWKGLHVLLEAYRLLPLQCRERSAWHLITPDDLSAFSIPDGFHIHRPQNDDQLVPILRRGDIFLSTSLWEGFGLPALEAMACGCAVVTSQNGGCREYAGHGVNCLTYPPNDPARLAEHLAQLIEDSRLRSRLSRNGRRTAARFTWQEAARRLLVFVAERVAVSPCPRS